MRTSSMTTFDQPLHLISSFREDSQHDQTSKREMVKFLQENPDGFKRSNLSGHFTGSAWILDRNRTHTLLTHHMKLGIWVQLGGHADGDSDLLRVATTEAHEESGLAVIDLPSPNIFDMDIHRIPEHKGIPAHLHYDIRFLFEADRDAPLVQNHESRELKWIPLNKVETYNSDEGMLRMVRRSQ
jgi:ADP-ribose pyrophosphatase YjhB (NUDIX family)